MWKDYSWSYIKNNKTSGMSVVVAAFISALLLSLLCSLFYNFWRYDIEQITREEGGYHGRITGRIEENDIEKIRNYANVKIAVRNDEESDGETDVIDIYFNDMRAVFRDMPRIAELIGKTPDAVTYNYELLNMYLIRDPDDPAPRMLFPLYLMIMAAACLSLIMIIHNSFAVSMNDRVHQFGILQSVGATTGQIRICLLQEAALICAIPVLVGNLLGILLGMGCVGFLNLLLDDVSGRYETAWEYHPYVFLITMFLTIITVWISAWLPARKMSRMTPLEAIKNTGELPKESRRKNFRILSALFGVEGELAGGALRARKKALRTATISLTFAFLAFCVMQCFFTLSVISQRMTYFARYQDAWDIMITVKNTGIDEIAQVDELQEIAGIRSCVVYQKEELRTWVAQEDISEELKEIGGLQNAPESYVQAGEDGWSVNAPLLILDDASFLAYCGQIGAPERLDGVIIRNSILDFSNPDFRNREQQPYLKQNRETTTLFQDTAVTLPVISYTQELPLLREEYGTLNFYELVHVLPLSMWKGIKERTDGAEQDSYVRILAEDGVTLDALNELEEKAAKILGQDYETEIENRIQDKTNNDQMIDGMKMIMGGFCVLLAIIGIGNVFSNTLSFVRQRRRELARYMSVGLTPEGIRKMFCVEALVIAGRPLVLTLPATVVLVGLMIKASYLEPMVFIKEAPILPICIFFLAIFGFVALAYYLGGRKVLRCDLAATLRDDTMV